MSAPLHDFGRNGNPQRGGLAMAKFAKASADLDRDRFAKVLNAFVGMGRDWSVAELAEATGIPERTMKGYKEGRAAPPLGNFLRMAAVLGPEFVNQVLEPAGLGGAHSIVSDHIVDIFDLADSMSRASSEIIGKAARGHLTFADHAAILALTRTVQAKSGLFLWKEAGISQ
ncbi:helix-turn-helix domain-containing protein [Hwanghaeella sp.]|uniref:helix-turn-helix domain-containing protein n=1 Tax=Hwanghaeella sp. TaxID=2605943 RepID=UPI003CCB9D0E